MAGSERSLMIRIAGRVDPSLQRACAGAKGQVSGLTGMFSKFGSMATMALGGAGIIGAVSKTLNTYKDYQDALAYTGAIAGATSEDLEKMNKAALEAGAGTSKTATESAQALGYLALAGWDVESSTKALLPILHMSEATQMDLATCSDMVTDSMSALGIESKDLSGYLDVLCKANNKSNQTAQQLMDAFIKCGGTMKGLGVSTEEASTALGILANRGLKGAEAGQSLNAIVANLTTGQGRAGKAMQELGISAFDSNGKFIGMQNTLLRLNDATKGLTQEQRNTYFAMIGGKENVKALNGLMQGLTRTTADGKTEWNALAGELGNADGAMEGMRNKMTTTLGYGMKTFGSALDNLMIRIGESLGPALTPALNNISNELLYIGNTVVPIVGKQLESAAKIIQDNWGTIGPIIKGIGIGFASWKIAGFILALPQLVEGINAAIAAQKALTAAKMLDKWETIQIQALYWKDIAVLGAHKVAQLASAASTGAMTLATGIWAGVCATATAVTTALGAAFTFLTSPIGLVLLAIAAVIAAGVWLYNNWDLVKAKAGELGVYLSQVWATCSAYLTGLWNGLVASVQALWGQISAAFQGVWSGICQYLQGIIDFITGVFTGNWSQAWQGIVSAFGAVFGGLSGMAAGPINAIIGLVNELIGKINSVSFDIPGWVPGWGGKHIGFNAPTLPQLHLAKGGVTTGPTTALIGEGQENEAVLPLSKLSGMLGEARVSGSNNVGGATINYSPNFYVNSGSKEDVDKAASQAFAEFKNFMAKYQREQKRFNFASY